MPLLLSIAASALLLGFWLFGGASLSVFAEEPPRAMTLAATIALFSAAPLVSRRVGKLTSVGEAHERQQDWMLLLGTVLSLILAAVSPWSDAAGWGRLPIGSWLRWTGLALYIAGVVFMLWAPLHQGRHFSSRVTILPEHELMTDGPFRFIRHPRYVGCMAWGLGLALVFLSGPGLAVGALYCLSFAWRIRDEEHLLAKHFGNEWSRYAKRTKRIVPFLF
jgi:protein-S-isoprenylcysteine O-methyltransferase Ste14